jgi:phenylalanyl-tRNA synthetase beta chain
MRISLNWLKQYVDVTISPEELADRLTMVGLEVESIEHLGAKYERFFVGKVLEVEKHIKADKLLVCKVEVGDKNLQIVCGANNVTVGQKVPVGIVGAVVPRNQHDPDGKPFILSEIKIRGVDSFGMICSEYELEVGEDKSGIMILSPEAKSGTPLAEYLSIVDTVFEVGITPNRPDAMSHIGIAREVGALLDCGIKIPQIKIKETNKKITDFVSIKIEDNQKCPRYSARIILNAKVDRSPDWLHKKLIAVNIRPINNVVDITNYVLMECGHPLHSFDYDKISDHALVIRCAKSEETFTTLDHKKRALREDTLMICDINQPIAMAGIMGGENTEITSITRNIFLESAYFTSQSIRSTSKHFGLSTDASQRFERGADPNITLWAVDRAAQLIQEICGGEVLQGIIDFYPDKYSEKVIELRVQKSNEILGLSLSADTISNLLKKFHINIFESKTKRSSEDILNFCIPTFRPDIEREIDLIEEVARAYGYDKIDIKTTTSFNLSNNAQKENFVDDLRKHAISSGFLEIVTNSMQDVATASLTTDKIVKISNPLSKDMEALRSSLIPSVLDSIRNNIDHGIKDIRLFEIGKVYFNEPASQKRKKIDRYSENERIVFALSGIANPPSWDQKTRYIDIFDVKGEILSLFKKISLDNIKFIPYSNTDALTQYGLVIENNGEYIGSISVIRSDILSKYNIAQEIIVAELGIEAIAKSYYQEKQFRSLPKYPSVVRDIAIVVDEVLPIEKVENEIKSVCGTLLTKLELFDIYTGAPIAEGKKSYAYALELMAEDHTMTQDEIDTIMQNMIDHLQKNLNATIRK